MKYLVRRVLLIGMVSTLSLFIGCDATTKNTYIVPTDIKPSIEAVRVKTVPNRVAMGMDWQDFEKFCDTKKHSKVNDSIRSYETAEGVTSLSRYLEYSEFRADRNCYGVFLFVDWKLTAIGK